MTSTPETPTKSNDEVKIQQVYSQPRGVLSYAKIFVLACYHGVFHAAVRNAPARPFRELLRLPVVFDLTSILLQLLDLPRVIRLDRTENVAASKQDAFAHNIKVTRGKLFTMTRRAEPYYAALCLPQRNLREERLLIIGPRNIQELFIAWLYGFRWKNIEGIDLFSTNPKIKVMDMEAMDHPDESFDSIASANTLAYAKDPVKALTEIARIPKPGGQLVFDTTYHPAADRFSGNKIRGEAYREMIGQVGLEIYYYSSRVSANARGQNRGHHYFGVRKPLKDDSDFDKVKIG